MQLCIVLQVPFCEEKVFSYSKLHFSEVTSYEIHTLVGKFLKKVKFEIES